MKSYAVTGVIIISWLPLALAELYIVSSRDSFQRHARALRSFAPSSSPRPPRPLATANSTAMFVAALASSEAPL